MYMENVSVYIPCYNNIDTIAEALNSIKRQTVAVNDLFVIDDGSTDGSAEAVEAMGIRVIRNERNLGRGAVRNRAMTEVKNELVLCCDATNVLPVDFVSRLLPWFDDPKVAAVYGWIQDPHPKGVVARWRARHLFKAGQPMQIRHYSPLITYGTLMRRSLALEAGNFNQALRHSEDMELGERLLAAGFDIVFDPTTAVVCNAQNTLSQVLGRYWRWYAGKDERVSLKGYLKQIWYSLKVMAVQDIKAGDFLCIPISLFVPHYQFWKSLFRKPGGK